MCQTQAGLLKDLKQDLAAQNQNLESKLEFVCVNHDTWQDRFYYSAIKQKLQHMIPIVQDENINSLLKVWEKYDAQKDDIYVIDREGKVAKFYAKPDSFLSRTNVKDGIEEVLKGSPC